MPRFFAYAMKICRYRIRNQIRIGMVTGKTTMLDLTAAGITRLQPLLENADSLDKLRRLAKQKLPRVAINQVRLCAPLERQEVWAAGVTYLRSKVARIEESDFSALAYDKVYSAERPELFFKSVPEKVVPTGEPVGIRRDARWSVPEPELALVLNSNGKVVGYTVGNDMSSRDIEGENLLYLPQAKIYTGSCALGPWITLSASETAVRKWRISIAIQRSGEVVFSGETSAGQIKRGFDELAGFLFRSQTFPHGAIMLTGTGIVPAATFSLRERDTIRIEISGIGCLENTVVVV